MASFYLRFRGQVTGPYAGAEVRRMLDRELVTSAHELSTDRIEWSPARAASLAVSDEETVEVAEELPAASDGVSFLDDLFRAPSAGGAIVLARASFPRRLPMVIGLSCGLLVMYGSLAPVAWREDGGPAFWWDGPGGFGAAGLASLVLGGAAAVVGSLGEPGWRGMVTVILATAGLLAMLAVGLEGAALALSAAVQAVAASSAAVALACGVPRAKKAVPPAAVAAAIFAGGAVIVLSVAAWRFADIDSSPGARYAVLQGVNLVVTGAAWMAILAIGIVEHAAMRPPRTVQPQGNPSV